MPLTGLVSWSGRIRPCPALPPLVPEHTVTGRIRGTGGPGRDNTGDRDVDGGVGVVIRDTIGM